MNMGMALLVRESVMMPATVRRRTPRVAPRAAVQAEGGGSSVGVGEEAEFRMFADEEEDGCSCCSSCSTEWICDSLETIDGRRCRLGERCREREGVRKQNLVRVSRERCCAAS